MIYSRENAKTQVENWKKSGEVIVFTNGCFDILHAGHATYLEKAKSFGTKLIVGLNTDASVRKIKGLRRPIQTEINRAKVVEALKSVDGVVLFDEDTPLELIKQLKPDVLVKGGDYTMETIIGSKEVLGWGGTVEIIPLLKGVSSTSIISKIKALSKEK